MRTLQQRGYIDEVGRDPGPGQAVLFGTTRLFLERLGLDRLDDLPPLGDFVPGADVVEALEQGLRAEARPPRRSDAGDGDDGRADGADDDGSGEAGLDDGAVPPSRRALRRHRPDERLTRGADGRAAAEGAGPRRLRQPAGLRGADRRRPGDGQRRGRRARRGGSTPTPTGSRSTACRSASGPGLVHYLLNKPAGVVTTAADPQGRPTVVELVPDRAPGVPGRPPRPDTEGLLLLTNDGELAHRLTHPSFGVEKEYLRRGRGHADAGRAAPPARGRRARRRAHRAGPGRPGRARRAAPHDPRGPQPPGAAHVRGRRPPRACAWCAPGSARWPTAALAPGRWRPLTLDEVRALSDGRGSACSAVASPPCRVVRALRGATTVDDDTRDSHRARRRAAEELFERNGSPRRPHQHPLHRHRRHPLDLPGHGGARIRLGDVPLICARSSTSPARAALHPGACSTSTPTPPGRAAPRVPRGAVRCARPPDGHARRAAPAARRAIVVGTGLIGGSIGLALRGQGWHVAGRDRDAGRAERALELGRHRRRRRRPRTPSITFVATPVARRSPTRPSDALAARPGLVTDVGSVKAPVVERRRRPPLRRRPPDGRLRAGGRRRRRRRPVRGRGVGADARRPAPTPTPTPLVPVGGVVASAPRWWRCRPSATTRWWRWCPTCPTSPPPP